MVRRLTEPDALALEYLINLIPSCGAEVQHDVEAGWSINAGSETCECGWLIQDVEAGLAFLYDHFELVGADVEIRVVLDPAPE